MESKCSYNKKENDNHIVLANVGIPLYYVCNHFIKVDALSTPGQRGADKTTSKAPSRHLEDNSHQLPRVHREPVAPKAEVVRSLLWSHTMPGGYDNRNG